MTLKLNTPSSRPFSSSSRRRPGPIQSLNIYLSSLLRLIRNTFTITWVPAFVGMTMLLILTTFAFAGSLPSERLRDPALESRAVAIFTQLRCLVCQNETIADSDARIAKDLRLLVRTQIEKGDSDKQIIDFIHGRYGDYVLMKPPLKYSTWALWFSPLMLLLIGAMIVAGILHRQRVKPQP